MQKLNYIVLVENTNNNLQPQTNNDSPQNLIYQLF